MSPGIQTIVYPVTDLAKAKAIYSKLLGTEPYADAPYYVGFRVGDHEIGLDPNGHKDGAVAYAEVDDISGKLQELVAAGATLHEDAKDVGGGKLIATVRDADGNLIGLTQEP